MSSLASGIQGSSLPIIDLGAWLDMNASSGAKQAVVKQIGDACKEIGFFYVTNHGVSLDLCQQLFREGRHFFEQPVEKKNEVSMNNSPQNREVRGYFPLDGELTLNKPDRKEGYYFGAQLERDHPKVIIGEPMHGPNKWPSPSEFPGFDKLILTYMDILTNLGHKLMEAVALSLNLDQNFFREKFTAEPFTPFRLFYYPKDSRNLGEEEGEERWGVGEHTDYGVLTMLLQDDVGGLQVKRRDGTWIEAPYVEGSFVVNIGDMLEIWTCGYYRATPHRVKNYSRKDRISAPFFFDPNFDCMIQPLEQYAKLGLESPLQKKYSFPLRYGDYIFNKVMNCFPALKRESEMNKLTREQVMF
jgi:isopenicillin N synthase-like dioxygenase